MVCDGRPCYARAHLVIIGADGAEHIFPPGFDPKRAAAIVRRDTTPKDNPGGAALGLAAAEPAANLAMRFATSPTAARTGGVLGRIGGAVVPPIAGANTQARGDTCFVARQLWCSGITTPITPHLASS